MVNISNKPVKFAMLVNILLPKRNQTPIDAPNARKVVHGKLVFKDPKFSGSL